MIINFIWRRLELRCQARDIGRERRIIVLAGWEIWLEAELPVSMRNSSCVYDPEILKRLEEPWLRHLLARGVNFGSRFYTSRWGDISICT